MWLIPDAKDSVVTDRNRCHSDTAQRLIADAEHASKGYSELKLKLRLQ